MEIRLTQKLQARLDQLSTEIGCSTDDLIQNAMAGYFDELAEVRATLDCRYEDVVTDRVKLIPGEEVIARLRERSVARCGLA